MNEELGLFLRDKSYVAEETAVWVISTFQVTTYLCSQLPPLPYLTSVRCVVLRHNQVLIVQDPNGFHILPGGRREPNETVEETVEREVLEETGWRLQSLVLIGFKHFHHLTPCPPGYAYPYPDFLQAVYAGTAVSYHPTAIDTNGHELGTAFCPITEASAYNLSSGEQILLQAALNAIL